MSACESVLRQLRLDDRQPCFLDAAFLPGSRYPGLHELQIAEHNAAWAQERQRLPLAFPGRAHLALTWPPAGGV
jgi:hypothetical protein